MCALLVHPFAQKAYKVLNLATRNAFITRDVTFYETIFPLKTSQILILHHLIYLIPMILVLLIHSVNYLIWKHTINLLHLMCHMLDLHHLFLMSFLLIDQLKLN